MTSSIPNPLTSFMPPRAVPAAASAAERMLRARQRSAFGWLAAAVVAAHLAGLNLPWQGDPLAWLWFGLTAAAAAAMLGVGLAQLALLARTDRSRRGVVTAAGVLTALGILTAPLAGVLAFVGGIFHMAAPLAAVGLGIVLLFAPHRNTGARPWAGAAFGSLVAVLALTAGVLDTLVLLPLAMTDGMPLTEIYAAMDAAGEGGTQLPIAWALMWTVGFAVLAAALIRRRARTDVALGILIAGSAIALFGLPVTQFGIGMSISDTLYGAGGISAALPAMMFGAAALTALAAALLIGATNRR